MVRLDRLNVRILELLQRDGRITLSEIARQIDRGESTVRERLMSLEKAGLIEGYRAIVNAPRLGLKARAFLRADCDVAHVQDVGRRLAAVPNVVRCFLTTGPKPLRVEVVAEDMDTLTRVVERRIAGPDLLNLETGVMMQEIVPWRSLPLPSAVGQSLTVGNGSEHADAAASELPSLFSRGRGPQESLLTP